MDCAPVQRLRRGQGDRRGVAGAARRRAPPGLFGQHRRHHAPDWGRHAVEVQGDEPGRARGQFRGVLRSGPLDLDCLGEAPIGDEKGSNQGLEKLGFPWILSSELSFFNNLRAIFCENIFATLPGHRGGARRCLPGVRCDTMSPARCVAAR